MFDTIKRGVSRTLPYLALAAVLVGVPLAVGSLAPTAALAAGTPQYSTAVKTLLASAARTATVTGTAVTTSVSTQPVLSFNVALADKMRVVLVDTAASGTLDITIAGSTDNSNFVTLQPVSGMSNTAWTQVTGAGNQERTFTGPLPPYIRAVGTEGSAATDPRHTYSVIAILGG